jgi:UPF0271 protein
MELDLNCDLGEGGPFDEALMPLVTSANVACGAHAGDETTARAALSAAAWHGVRVGAHPGYPDRANFGRLEQPHSYEEVWKLCSDQVRWLEELAEPLGVTIRYLKPHGALYNQACRDDAYAAPVAALAEQLGLIVIGLPGSRLEARCAGHCPFIAEGFADRRYLPDGSLVPRSQPNAFVEDPQEAVVQARRLLRDGGVRTLCVHGDNPAALAFVRALRDRLMAEGVVLRAFA